MSSEAAEGGGGMAGCFVFATRDGGRPSSDSRSPRATCDFLSRNRCACAALDDHVSAALKMSRSPPSLLPSLRHSISPSLVHTLLPDPERRGLPFRRVFSGRGMVQLRNNWASPRRFGVPLFLGGAHAAARMFAISKWRERSLSGAKCSANPIAEVQSLWPR